jgi:hypothetical protein
MKKPVQTFEFPGKNIHGQLLRYEFEFESYEFNKDAYYDAAVWIRIYRLDIPAKWNMVVFIKDAQFQWLPVWPEISDEAKNYISRIYKQKAFW